MTPLRSAAILGAAAVAMSAAALASPTARQVSQAAGYQKFGSQALRSGNLQKAREYFDKALHVLPELPEAHLGLGHIAMSEKRYTEALREYERAREAYAQMGESLWDLRMQRYTETQRRIQALRDDMMNYQRLSRRFSGAAPGWEARATEVEMEIRRLEAVKPPDKDTLGEPPGELFFYIGNAMHHLDRIAEAVGAWETCTRTIPDFALVYNNLAVGYWRLGRLDDARGSLARAETLGLAVSADFKRDLDRSLAARK